MLDRLLALAARHRIDREIEVFGLLGIWLDEGYGFGKVVPDAPDAMRVRCLDEATGRITYLRTASDLQVFIVALRDHFAELGVLDRVRITADESDNPDQLARSLGLIEDVAPGLRYKLAIASMGHDHEWPADVTDYSMGMVPAAQQLDGHAGFSAASHARGGKVTYYLCCREPYPNSFVHSPLVEGELIGWFTHRTGLDGFLRWAFCLWPSDPWKKVTRQSAFDYLPAGDMYFVLPGPDGAPVETLRYESLRAAIQDYELLRLVESRLTAPEAAAVIARAYDKVFRTNDMADFAKVGGVGPTAALSTPATVRPQDLYSLDPADFVEARQILLEALGA